jgi:cell division protein FtsL
MIGAVFRSKVRGFRVINVAALGLAAVMALGVYWAKTSAAHEAGAIDDVQRQIVDEQRRSRLLQAEIAYLERPDRLTELAAGQHLAPVPADREATLDALGQIAQSGSVHAP